MSTFSTNGHFWPKNSHFWPKNVNKYFKNGFIWTASKIWAKRTSITQVNPIYYVSFWIEVKMAIFDPKMVTFDSKTRTKVFLNIFISTALKNCPSIHCIIHFAFIFVNLFYQSPFLTQTQQFLTTKWSFLTKKQEKKFFKIFSSWRHQKTVLVNIVSSILP